MFHVARRIVFISACRPQSRGGNVAGFCYNRPTPTAPRVSRRDPLASKGLVPGPNSTAAGLEVEDWPRQIIGRMNAGVSSWFLWIAWSPAINPAFASRNGTSRSLDDPTDRSHAAMFGGSSYGTATSARRPDPEPVFAPCGRLIWGLTPWPASGASQWVRRFTRRGLPITRS
jgi:hypothetical protein